MEKFLEWFLADDFVQFAVALVIILSIISFAYYMAKKQ